MNYSGIITEIQLGSLKVSRAPEITIRHDRYRPVSICYITLADPTGSMYRTVSVDDAVSLLYGYRDGAKATWSGTITYLQRGKDKLYLTCSDAGRDALKTYMTEYWMDESPAAIVRAALGKLGGIGTVQDMDITLPSFTASNISIYDLIRKVEHTMQQGFDVDVSQYALFIDESGVWNWGEHGLDGEIPVIASQNGLIAHNPDIDGYAGKKTVETWLVPGFTHSRQFKLKDTYAGVDGSFMADVVCHVFKQRNVRTFINYGGGYGKF